MDGVAAIGRLLRLAGVGTRDGVGTATDESPYVCLGCGIAYAVQYHVCPNCGGFSVENRIGSGSTGTVD